MKNKDKNRCPKKAKARAKGDLRCAARKLGMVEAQAVLDELRLEQAKFTTEQLAALHEAAK